MGVQIGPLLCLLVCISSVVQGDNQQRFLITAPSVFHVGVKERILIQVGETLLSKPVSCWLETEMRVPMSAKQTKQINKKAQVETMEIEILANEVSKLKSTNGEPPYLNLACEVEGKKWMTRVLVSQHTGYIFIQTDQPIYNPSEKGVSGRGTVWFRIFTLDHSMRPKSDSVHVSVFNADGNRIKKMMVNVDGILSKSFHIPDVSKPGIWKITAHYKGDEKNPAVREFKVQEFVLPSFGVSIQPVTGFLYVNAETFTFTIQALYTYGKTIDGGFHCRFGVKEEESEDKGQEIKFLRGLEQIGSVKKGQAEVAFNISDLKSKLMNSNLEDLAKKRFYIAVTVTDILSGEVQESEVFLPIVRSMYIVDLSRTRSYYTPKFPFEVVVMVRHPNGSAAANIKVQVEVSNTDEKPVTTGTDKEGKLAYAFNLKEAPPFISVTATVDDIKETRVVRPVRSSGNSFLYLTVSNKVLSLGESVEASFHFSGKPEDRHIYYMTVSRGSLREASSVLASGSLVKHNIPIKPEMIPSFRLIGFYYDTGGDIIADSVWVDVQDTCEGKLEIKLKNNHHPYQPGQLAELEVDVGKQKNAIVSLLAVDKAIYALGTQNKLTPKQVFTSMQSYDLGCSYGGGETTAGVFNDAGLAFISHSTTVRSMMRKGFSCESGFRRNKRSIDIQTEMARKAAAFIEEQQQRCCRHGFTQIPMKLTCEDRAQRVSKLQNKDCADAFRECCEFATKLRDKKRREDLRKGHARSANADEIEDFFDNEIQTVRRSFPPSFSFKEIKAEGKVSHKLYLPDSITTWEIQAVSSSTSHGFCVAEPVDLNAFKSVFLSLRLPYSVKRFEQLAIVVVIYNYGKMEMEIVVRMKTEEGLCSPGTSSNVKITLEPESSQTVTFSAVPMVTGEIPISIYLYEIEGKTQMDSIQKMLLVKNEGVEIRNEETYVINLDGRSSKNVLINGARPNNTVPETDFNVFVKLEEEGFGRTTALHLLSPSKVENLIKEPTGCGEQTMIGMSPTALSIRYLDKTNGWLELDPGSRDKALNFIEKGYERISAYKKPDGSYAAWLNHPTSTWLTALVVKVLSLVADRQIETVEQRGTTEKSISQEDIRKAVTYLIERQSSDGSFTDPNPVIHREMQGGIGGVEQDASLTAFITIALCRSLPFLDKETADVVKSISLATEYLHTRVDELKRPYAIAITAYCLSTCQNNQIHALLAWAKLKNLSVRHKDCLVWRDDNSVRLGKEARGYLVPSGVALTVETTAYALLTAVAHKDQETAHSAACFLSSQENYEGGFKSTQDTITALEALSEYALSIPKPPTTAVNAQFTVARRSEIEKLLLDKSDKKVETELKRLLGNNIDARFSGEGNFKMKVAMAYYAFKEDSNCDDVSITVTVEGKVEYTTQVQENYNYYDYDENNEERNEEEDLPRSSIEWFDARSRRKRDTSQNTQDTVTYTVCVGHAQGKNLSGMAIADITLLSGFVAVDADLRKLKDLVDRYISHYETTEGRVLLYFNEIEGGEICVSFGAEQNVPIGLVQPAPATFYDYYEPDRRCSVLYSAPKRSKMVSVLCADDVCQCAEKGCFTERKTLEEQITKKDRFEYVCYRTNIDYAFEVIVDSVAEESNFIMYTTTVDMVLRYNGDQAVDTGSKRVFVKRRHCKGELKVGETYLLMGTDGPTKDSSGNMQYLLDSNTWVEQKQTASTCKASVNKRYCKELKDFVKEYQVDGCNL